MTRRRDSSRVTRLLAPAALLTAVVVLAIVVFGGGPGYTVKVDFADAGQLISGDLVEVGGISVGTVKSMTLTADNTAQLTLSLHAFTPLHQGTTASIGTVGLSGVTNRFVALVPGPASKPLIHSGGTIPQLDTTPIVDIDELLDTFTPPLRQNLRQWIQEAATVLHANVGATRQTLTYSAAALQRTSAFIGQVTEDSSAFDGLLSSGANTAQAIASTQGHLSTAVDSTATALSALAGVQSQLSDAISRAPSSLDDATAFLTRLEPTLTKLEPVMADARPLATPLAALLTKLVPTATEATPVLSRLDVVLPELDRAFAALPKLAASAVPALKQTTTALTRAQPILTGLRPYGEDILMGFLHGYGGGSAENYDANGQFSRIALGLPGSTLLAADLGYTLTALSPHLLTGQTDKCPGSAAEPAGDGSNKIVADGCDPLETP